MNTSPHQNGPEFPSPIQSQQLAGSGGVPSDVDVGEILRRMDAGRELTGEELDQHIVDCCSLWQQAYARFQAHGNPADRDEAVLWLHRQNEAILMRSPVAKDAREAEIWADIFLGQGDAARARLSRGRR